MKNRDSIKKCLDNIVSVLLKQSYQVSNIGIAEGKMGMILFLLFYAKYSQNQNMKAQGEELLEVLCEEINEKTPVNYLDGLLGFGTAVEYLVGHRIIDIDTNELLEELDLLLESWRPYYSKLHTYQIVGCGKYLSMRLHYSLNMAEPTVSLAGRTCLEEMVNNVNPPRHYGELISLVDVMAELSALNIVNAETAKNHVKNLLNQIEAIVSANIKQENCLITLKPLEVCAMLVGACRHSKINCLEKVKSFLDVYEPDFRKFLSLDIDGLSSGGFKWSVLYHYLGKSLNNDNYLQLSEQWLTYSLQKYEDIIVGVYQDRTSLKDWNGYSQIGLALLYLMGECPEDIFDVLPLYLL